MHATKLRSSCVSTDRVILDQTAVTVVYTCWHYLQRMAFKHAACSCTTTCFLPIPCSSVQFSSRHPQSPPGQQGAGGLHINHSQWAGGH